MVALQEALRLSGLRLPVKANLLLGQPSQFGQPIQDLPAKATLRIRQIAQPQPPELFKVC
jgi:hypothetical protein